MGVDAGARPTLVAARSHNTFYYTHDNPWKLLSRYSDAWVRANYRVEPMLGAAGGGFLFDTNGLHKGLLPGNTTRTVLILEFQPHGKVQRPSLCIASSALPALLFVSAS